MSLRSLYRTGTRTCASRFLHRAQIISCANKITRSPRITNTTCKQCCGKGRNGFGATNSSHATRKSQHPESPPVASLPQLNCLGPIHRTTPAFRRSKQAYNVGFGLSQFVCAAAGMSSGDKGAAKRSHRSMHPHTGPV